jgi:transcriptional regulator with XRE-family HTH domain
MSKKSLLSTARGTLAKNLQLARTIFGWSQEDLGLECGLKRTYIGALERGEVSLGIDNLERLAKGIGVPTHVLLLESAEAYSHLNRASEQRNDSLRRPRVTRLSR